jgi:hypothetical protein
VMASPNNPCAAGRREAEELAIPGMRARSNSVVPSAT